MERGPDIVRTTLIIHVTCKVRYVVTAINSAKDTEVQI